MPKHTVIKTKIIVPAGAICPFWWCDKNTAHEHARYTEEGWDLSHWAWHISSDKRSAAAYDAVERD